MNLQALDYSMIAGLSGVVLYLLSYALLQLRFIQGNGYLYPFMNAAAAICVLISLMRDFNAASALIQISFISISAVGIFRLFYIRNQISFTDRETSLLNGKLKNLPNDIAKKFFDKGDWVKVKKGTMLCQTGEQISHLYYIDEGKCAVTIGKKTISTCQTGDFVGEITCFNGENATGDVTCEGEVSLFKIDTAVLRTLCKENPQLRFEIEKGMADNLRTKVARTNEFPIAKKKKSAPKMLTGVI